MDGSKGSLKPNGANHTKPWNHSWGPALVLRNSTWAAKRPHGASIHPVKSKISRHLPSLLRPSPWAPAGCLPEGWLTPP